MISVELDHATVAFTDRTLNVGLFSGEDPDAVRQNIDKLQASLDVDEIYVLKQIHGSTIVDVDDRGADHDDPPIGDGLFTSRAEKALLITGADCPPVAIAGPDSLVMLHCGWKPLAAGIVEAALGHVGEGPLQAAIGPGISQSNYEVGREVVAELGADGEAAFSDGHISLHQVIETKLRRGGVDRIEKIDACTFGNPDDYFSYRRDGAPTGRQAGIAWRS